MDFVKLLKSWEQPGRMPREIRSLLASDEWRVEGDVIKTRLLWRGFHPLAVTLNPTITAREPRIAGRVEVDWFEASNEEATDTDRAQIKANNDVVYWLLTAIQDAIPEVCWAPAMHGNKPFADGGRRAMLRMETFEHKCSCQGTAIPASVTLRGMLKQLLRQAANRL